MLGHVLPKQGGDFEPKLLAPLPYLDIFIYLSECVLHLKVFS